MRILVINRQRSHAALLGSALKRLGHSASLCAPSEALDHVAEGFDAAIVEASPEGPALAADLRAASFDELPVALAGEVEHLPEDVVTVLPRVWTVADLRRVLGDFDVELRRFARGSMPAAEFELDDDAGEDDVTPPLDLLPVVPPRLHTPRIEVSCRSWAKVEQMCEQAATGRALIKVRGRRRFDAATVINALVRLPDELVLSFPARVASCHDEGDGRYATVVELGAVSADGLRALIPPRA